LNRACSISKMHPHRNSPARVRLLTAFLIDIRLRLISLAVRFCRLRTLALWMGQRFAQDPSPLQQTEIHTEALRITKRVLHVNRRMRIIPASCLVESFTLWWMLRRRRIPADLRIGVRTITGIFESHAWVELDGTVLNDIAQVAAIYSAVDVSPLLNGRLQT